MTSNVRSTLVAALLAALVPGCSDKKSSQSGPSQPPSESAAKSAASAGWQPTVKELLGAAQTISVKAPGAATFAEAATGTQVAAGSLVRTGPTTLAVLALGDGTTIWLNHSTEMQVLPDRPGASVLTGQVVIDHRGGAAGAAPQKPPRIIVPTGELDLVGTKVVVLADSEESSVAVSQGQVAIDAAAQQLDVYAGEEVLLPRSGSPRVVPATDLDESLGWIERPVLPAPTEAKPDSPPPDPTPVPRGLGKLVGKVPGGERERPLELSKHRVTVRIRGNVAYTEVTEVFRNPTGQTLEGVYRFPLPGDAQISRLALKVGNRMMEGEFLETRRAERIWSDIIEQWRDPAMLKWKHGNQFELRIFPIEPRSSRLVTIGYTQKLRPVGDGYRYAYPMARDHAGLARSGVFEFDAQIFGLAKSAPVQVVGYDAEIEPGSPEQPAATRVRYRKEDFWAAGDLVIRFAGRGSDEVQAWGFKGRDRDGFMALTVRPQLPRAGDRRGRDFVVILDSSYSRQGLTMELQEALLPKLVAEMDDSDRLVAIACASSCAPIGSPDFTPVRERDPAALAKALSDIRAQGATHIVEPVRVAAALLGRRTDRARSPHLVYLTDGIASAGELRPAEMTSAVAHLLDPLGARLGVVDLGGDTDETNLEALARAGRGAVIRLDPAMSMTGHALRILQHHYGAVLTEPVLSLPDGVERIHPRELTSLSAGGELTVAARLKGPVTGQVTLRGKLGGQPYEKSWDISIDPVQGGANSFIPRLWASLAIRDLELDAGANKREIIKLSKRYGVLSRFTTLLALESRDMMDEFGVRKRKRDDWRGDDAPIEAPLKAPREAEDGTEAPAKGAGSDYSKSSFGPRSNGKKKSARPSAKPVRPELPGLDNADGMATKDRSPARSFDDDFDDPFYEKPAKRPRTKTKRSSMGRSKGRRWRRAPDTFKVRAPAAIPTRADRKNVERRTKQFAAEPNNRSKRMRLIRAHVRAGDIGEAAAETRLWLKFNPFDPEALVQQAQIMAYEGNAKHALAQLESALDTAPRGKWLQERIHKAYIALADPGRSCAHDVARQAVRTRPRKGVPAILECPPITDVGVWFGAPPRPVGAPPEGATATAKQLRGHLQVAIEWTGDGDIDIQLIEPNGRVLHWLSQRQKLVVSDLRATAHERLTLPRMRNGTYRVRLVRVRGAKPLQVRGTVKVNGKTLRIDDTISTDALIVAEAVRRGGRR